MAKMNSKFKYMLDEAPEVTFRARAQAALTADANSTELSLDKLKGYWNTQGELADTTLAIVVNVTAADFTSADEVYKLDAVFGPVGFATSIVGGTLPTIKGPGQYVMLIDIDTVKAQKADIAAVRLALDVSGTTPSIVYNAFIGGAILN